MEKFSLFSYLWKREKKKIELCNQQKSLEENIALTMVMAVEYSTPTKWIFFFFLLNRTIIMMLDCGLQHVLIQADLIRQIKKASTAKTVDSLLGLLDFSCQKKREKKENRTGR